MWRSYSLMLLRSRNSVRFSALELFSKQPSESVVA
jgi:hypothetical protein